MKRFIVFLFLLLFICLGGCTKKRPDGEILQTDLPCTTDSTIAETTSPPYSYGEGRAQALTLHTYEEYEEFFANLGGFPENFITYDAISSLGSFKAFVAQSYYIDNQEFNHYFYSLYLEGYSLYFYVCPKRNDPPLHWVRLERTMIGTDMRRNNTVVPRGKIACDVVTYRYLNAELSSLDWLVGDTEIRICYFDELIASPKDFSHTLFGRMLDWSTAHEALSELRQKTDALVTGLPHSKE